MKTIALCFALLLIRPQNAVRPPNLSTPEAALRSFFAAFSKEDFKGAAACVVGAHPDRLNNKSFDLAARTPHGSFVITDLHVNAQQDTASATYNLTIGANNGRQRLFSDQTVGFKRIGTNWKIVPITQKDAHTRSQKQQKYASTLAFMVAMPEEALETMVLEPKRAAESNLCLTKIRQLCLAALKYAQDNGGGYNFKPTAYEAALTPYVKNKRDFHCPLDTKGESSYSFNRYLAGQKLSAIASPSTTVLIYEGKNETLNFRHNGKASVGFADGHVKLVTATEAKSLRWKPR